MKRIILDVDTGIDDALAIILALRLGELKVEAVTTVAGNVEVEQATANTLRVLELAGRADIPVAQGAAKPLLRPLRTAKEVHGEDGLGNTYLPSPKAKPVAERAWELIVSRALAAPGQLTLVATGPQTNLALALLNEPKVAPAIKELVFMGGAAFCPGNTGPRAEFNIFTDPEAARIVLRSGIPITMVSLDVTEKCLLTQKMLDEICHPDPLSRFVRAITGHCLAWHHRVVCMEGMPLHDPLAVAVAADETLVEARPAHVDVETKGELTVGETVVDIRPGKEAAATSKTKVCLGVDSARFVAQFMAALKKG
jgi:purine nucleosidase